VKHEVSVWKFFPANAHFIRTIWCGNGVPTPLVLALHPCTHVSIHPLMTLSELGLDTSVVRPTLPNILPVLANIRPDDLLPK